MSGECDLFCERCGDCLRCYGEDSCYPGYDAGQHVFPDSEDEGDEPD